jgi:hypothetical protein
MIPQSSYVYQNKYHYQEYAELEHFDPDELALTRCPNFLHKDGRIYASLPNEDYYAVTVSPLNPNFFTQIEPGVKDIIQSLLEKNYLPISSCEGHGGSPLFFRVAFGNLQLAEDFKKHLSSIPFFEVHIANKISNIVQYEEFGKIKYRKRVVDEFISNKEEAKEINRLFKRSYDEVYFADCFLHKVPSIWFELFHPIKTYKIRKDKRLNLEKRKQQIINSINEIECYYL